MVALYIKDERIPFISDILYLLVTDISLNIECPSTVRTMDSHLEQDSELLSRLISKYLRYSDVLYIDNVFVKWLPTRF